MHTPTPLLAEEWQSLHAQFARHETHALHLRLAATGLFIANLNLGWSLRFLALGLCLLWLLEAMLRTTQSRLGERLLLIETALRERSETPGLQLYSWWSARRGGAGALLMAYLRASLRPTVALPYVLLLAATVWAVMRY